MRPDTVFGADIIAGFPTETEEMFQHSLDIVDECGLTFLHVFPYSARPGTPAARMPQVAAGAIKERARRLRQRGAEALAGFLDRELGQRRSVLVETAELGRTEHFAQVRFAGAMTPGAIVAAEITGAEGAVLQARPAP